VKIFAFEISPIQRSNYRKIDSRDLVPMAEDCVRKVHKPLQLEVRDGPSH